LRPLPGRGADHNLAVREVQVRKVSLNDLADIDLAPFNVVEVLFRPFIEYAMVTDLSLEPTANQSRRVIPNSSSISL
jgi:hypothetical protein